MFKILALFAVLVSLVGACTDFYMNFSSPDIRLSVRTLDLGLQTTNWTITSWPRNSQVDFKSFPPMSEDQQHTGIEIKYGMVGITANWIGDNHWGFPSFFADSINEKGLSCSLLTLVDSKYEHVSERKTNVFAGSFCKWAISQYANVMEVHDQLDHIAIVAPDILAQHFILRDATGTSLVIEMVDGHKKVYLDHNDGVNGFGITTNEPTFDWHIRNVQHYEWKRTLARQAISVPGNWYPDERFMRVHMVKSGMNSIADKVTDYNMAFSLSAQVLNVISVPQGDQYGTDSGESSGEGSNDHTVFGVIRDHLNPTFYWRDNTNPTFRRIRLSDISLSEGSHHASMKLESGPSFIDMSIHMKI